MQAYIESLVKDAYAKWNSLEELDGIPLLTQGTILYNFNHSIILTLYFNYFQTFVASFLGLGAR